MQNASLPKFLFVGAAGDGKSSIIKRRADSTVVKEEDLPKVGREPGGVTKEVRDYRIKGHNDSAWIAYDTMGVGDHTAGVPTLVAAVRAMLEHNQIDGVIVTSMLALGRIGVASQIVKELIKHGCVRNGNEISPWSRVIICGTQSDRCDEDEIEDFKKQQRDFFKDLTPPHDPGDHQVAVCSVKGDDGMADLLSKMHILTQDRQRVQWDPEFDANGGSRRMSQGLCEVFGGGEELRELIQLEMEVGFAWSDYQWRTAPARLASAGATATSPKAVLQGAAEMAEQSIAESVGKEVVKKYSENQAKTGLGSGALKGGTRIIKKNAAEVGSRMLDVMTEGGTATLRSSAGDVVVQCGTRAAVSHGLAAGMSLHAGGAGAAAELVAGHFERTQERKKEIGFAVQVSTSAVIGCIGGGPLGAAVGAGVGSINWCVGQVAGQAVEYVVHNYATGNTPDQNPLLLRYKAKKDALEKKKREVQTCANDSMSASYQR